MSSASPLKVVNFKQIHLKERHRKRKKPAIGVAHSNRWLFLVYGVQFNYCLQAVAPLVGSDPAYDS